MALNYKYKPRSPDAWEKRANQQGGEFTGVIKADYKTFTPSKGDNYIRILPPTWSEEADHYGLDIYVHYGVGPDRGSVLCLNKMKGQKCPLCEAKARADRAGDEDLSKELNAGKRIAVWMIDRKDEAKGPMIWTMPWTLDRDFVKIGRDRSTGEVQAYDDPENGFDISFERTGDGIGTKYIGIQIARKESSVDQDILDYIVEEPLTNALLWLTYAEIKKLYEGGADDDDNPPAKDEAAARKPEREQPAAEEQPQPKWKPRGKAAQAEDPAAEEQPEREAAPEREAPRKEPAAGATSGMSRAEELRKKFGNRT